MAAGLSVARLHCANLLEPLGHVRLARMLRQIGSDRRVVGASAEEARAILDRSRYFDIGGGHDAPSSGAPQPTDLIGGYFVRGGPLRPDLELSQADRERLFDLDLDPVLVGIDRGHLELLIAGDVERLANRHSADVLRVRSRGLGEPGTGGGGDWIVRSPDIPVRAVDGDPSLLSEDPDLFQG